MATSTRPRNAPRQFGSPKSVMQQPPPPPPLIPTPSTVPRWRLSGKRLIALVALFIVIYILYGILLPPVTTVTNTRSFTLSVNQTLFIKVFNGTTTALKLHSVSPSAAVFYVSKLPVLYNPFITFSLTPLASINVSSDGSQNADMNIQLLSNGVSNVKLQLTPLQTVLGIRPSPGLTIQNPAGLGGVQNATGVNSLITTSSTSTTSTSTTVQVNTTAVLFQKALALLTQSGIGGLMSNYNKLYQKDIACNQSTYNSTYQVYYHALPPAPVSFANVSAQTPTKLNITEALLPQSNVKITYLSVAPSSGSSGPALVAVVNTSTASFLKSVNFTGIYTGLNSMVLNSSYTFQSRILNNCGAYISPH